VSLVAGHGPLSSQRVGRLSPPVDRSIVLVEPHPRRVRAVRGDDVLLDTERCLLVHREGHPLSYAFPAELAGDLPATPVPEAPGYVTVPWAAVDAWFEEGRRLVHYPPNPYHRVDCRSTTRRLRVTVAGETLVDTDETVIVFETALAPRLYVDPARVRTDLLRATDTSSYCNYKGVATYWAAVLGETVVPDVAWSYDEPLPESEPIRGLLSFESPNAVVSAELPAADQTFR
jgi:uncharacterized protein (DUF427 family)